MALYLGNELISNIFVGTSAESVNAIGLNTPSILINDNGLVTATVTQTNGGYVSANSSSMATLQLNTVSGGTVVPTSNQQTIAAKGRYTLDSIVVSAVPTETRTITSNGTYTPTAGRWFSSVTVDVEGDLDIPIFTSDEQATFINCNKTYEECYNLIATHDVRAFLNIEEENFVGTLIPQINNISYGDTLKYYYVLDGIPRVQIDYESDGTLSFHNGPPDVITSLNITQNGSYGNEEHLIKYVNVNVTPTLQAKSITITPSETSQFQTVSSSTYDGLSSVEVTVNAIPSNYVGSGVARKNGSDVSNTHETVTIPAGYYATTATYNISSAQLSQPSISINSSGLITAQSGVSQEGYIGLSSTSSKTQQLTTKAATTYTPTTTNQTIAAGTYLTGAQTIRGDSNLAAGNIKSGVQIFGVTGTFSGASVSNQNKTVTPSESSQSITADSGYTGLGTVTVNAITASYVGSGVARKSSTDLTISGATVTAPAGYYAANASKTIPNATISTRTLSYNTRDGVFEINHDITAGGYVAAASLDGTYNPEDITDLNIIDSETIITPTETEQVAVSYGTFVQDQVLVGPISSNYVGSGVTRRNNTDITASGATVTIPAGYYAAQQTKTVASGSAGTPTATKGTVSNHSISITPSVTNTAGYITGGTKTGTAVTVTASELVSDTLQITSNGTKDVTNYASVNVNINTVNNQNKTVTPSETAQSVSADTGYTGLGTVTVNAITASYVGSGITRRSSSNVSESLSYNSTNQKVTSAITVPAGYYESAGSKSISTTITDITDLPTQAANTITPTESEQTAIQANTWATGAVKVAAVSSSYVGSAITRKAATTITPGTTNQTIAAGTYLTGAQTIAGDADLVAGNIKSGVQIFGVTGTYAGTVLNNQAKSVTPTKSSQEVTPDSGYTGLSKVTVAAIPAAYITTSDANAVAANILLNKTAYVNGSKVTGTMPNNGATGGTITTQGGTYTIPAGYTSGGTVTASFAASTLTNSIIAGQAYEEEDGDYGWKTTITIPAGYHNAATIVKDFSSIFPAPDTPATTSQMLIGYQAYDADGQLLTGTMTNNGAYNNTLNDTRTSVTIPAGYHNGSGTISHTTVAVPNPTITVNSSGLITASGSWTKGFTTNNSYSKTSQLTTKAATTYTPTTASQSIAAGTYLTGAQTIQGDTNLVAGNIKSGVSIFGVSGTYSGPGVNLQDKTVSPSESQQSVTADSTYDGLGTVTVNAISTTYVGSGITRRSSSDLTASGATVNVPAGYYSSQASKAVSSMTLPTATSSTSSGTSKLTINRSTSDQYINIPTGYNSTASYYKISAVANGSVTAPSSISGTAATISTGSGTITLTKTVSVTPNVTTAGYISSGTAGNASVSLTASVTTKAAATITPGTSNQTIASGTYLTGTQTIAGDADLVAANIKKGVQIFNVTGTYTSDATAKATDINVGETAYVDGVKITGTQVINKFYTGANTPASSLGNNGDIYLQV